MYIYFLTFPNFSKKKKKNLTIPYSRVPYNYTVKSMALTYYTLPSPLQSDITCSPPLLSARAAASLPHCLICLFTLCLPPSLLALFLCFTCIISVNWLNIVKLSFGAAGGGRFAGSCNQYRGAMGPLWKSSVIKRCSSG